MHSLIVRLGSFEGKGKHSSFLRMQGPEKRFQWNANEYLSWAKRNFGDNSGPIADPSGKKHLAITYDAKDFPLIPMDSVDGNLTRLRPVFAEYLRILYGSYLSHPLSFALWLMIC